MVRRLGSALSLAATLIVSPCGRAAAEDSPWVVRGPRPATAEEVTFLDPNPLLRKPENPNYAPGPEGIAAVVETDREHFRHLFLENPLTGEAVEVVRGSDPRWSPDGKWIACSVWKSKDRPSVFSLADPASGTVVERAIGASADDFAWSPDGRLVAVAGLPGGRVEESSDLWLVELEGGTCRLTETDGIDESDPRWLDDRTLLYSAKSLTHGSRWLVLTLMPRPEERRLEDGRPEDGRPEKRRPEDK